MIQSNFSVAIVRLYEKQFLSNEKKFLTRHYILFFESDRKTLKLCQSTDLKKTKTKLQTYIGSLPKKLSLETKKREKAIFFFLRVFRHSNFVVSVVECSSTLF